MGRLFFCGNGMAVKDVHEETMVVVVVVVDDHEMLVAFAIDPPPHLYIYVR